MVNGCVFSHTYVPQTPVIVTLVAEYWLRRGDSTGCLFKLIGERFAILECGINTVCEQQQAWTADHRV